jgi:carboxylesterase type B
MAPPVGDLRWAAPQPKAPWSPAVLDASQYSAGCPQDCGLPPMTCPASISEALTQIQDEVLEAR